MKTHLVVLAIIAACIWWWLVNQNTKTNTKAKTKTKTKTKTKNEETKLTNLTITQVNVFYIGEDLIDSISEVRYGDIQEWLKKKTSNGYDIEFDKKIKLAKSWLFQSYAQKINDDTYGKLTLKSVPLYRKRGDSTSGLYPGWKKMSGQGYRSMIAGPL